MRQWEEALPLQAWPFCVQTSSSRSKAGHGFVLSITSAVGGRERWIPRAWQASWQDVKMVSFRMVVFRRHLVSRQEECSRRYAGTHLCTTHIAHMCIQAYLHATHIKWSTKCFPLPGDIYPHCKAHITLPFKVCRDLIHNLVKYETSIRPHGRKALEGSVLLQAAWRCWALPSTISPLL